MVRILEPIATALQLPAPCRIELMGGFQLTVGTVKVHLPLPAQRLLGLLALHDKPAARSYVAGQLWPDVTENRARGNLRSTIWRLGLAQQLVGRAACLSLPPSVEIDAVRVSCLANQVITGRGDPAADVLEVLVMARELLPDWYDEWLLFERERFNQLRLLALDCLTRQLLAKQCVPEATTAALRAVQIEPLRDSSQSLLIECHIAQGNRAGALRQYQSYDRMLRGEMGLQPSAALTGLVAELSSAG
jgi:DNA-binding SARP family transcriptional activator